MQSETTLISGQLEAFPVASVLQFLGANRASGTLSLSFRDLRAFVSMEEGMIIAASPAKPRGASNTPSEEELLAGVAEISAAKFTTAILIGRGARYLIEGVLALWYGERAMAYIRAHGVEVAAVVVVLVLIGFLIYLRWPRNRTTP